MHLVETANTSGKAARSPGKRWILHRWLAGIADLYAGNWQIGSHKPARRLRVLETLAVGPKKQLLLVCCDGERYLVGTGPDTVQTIIRMESWDRSAGRAITTTELGERY